MFFTTTSQEPTPDSPSPKLPTVSTNIVSVKSKIGVSLSGGGIRATIFHLGVLKHLAKIGLLEHIRHISSVSGASLAIGLIYAKSGYRFPSSAVYLTTTLPSVRATILKHDIQDRALMSLSLSPWNWRRKVNLVAKAMETLWNIRGNISTLPPSPLWSINCTTFETGKDFRITQKEMGDYKIGYVPHPSLSIAEAIAASAGFPVLIGPYRLHTKVHGWTEPQSATQDGLHCSSCAKIPAQRALHLWDGGVYDNLGLEALYKISEGGHLTGDLNYLIVSNASSPSGCRKRDFFSPVGNVRRLLDITMDQVNALRSRDVTDYFKRTGNGCYLKIGSHPTISSDSVLSPEQVAHVKNYPTTLSSPSAEDFDLILRHGYEVAKHNISLFS